MANRWRPSLMTPFEGAMVWRKSNGLSDRR
jgi:hypothetical protein